MKTALRICNELETLLFTFVWDKWYDTIPDIGEFQFNIFFIDEPMYKLSFAKMTVMSSTTVLLKKTHCINIIWAPYLDCLFVKHFVQANGKNIKAQHYWHFVEGIYVKTSWYDKQCRKKTHHEKHSEWILHPILSYDVYSFFIYDGWFQYRAVRQTLYIREQCISTQQLGSVVL